MQVATLYDTVVDGKNLKAMEEFKTSEECPDQFDHKRWKKDSKQFLQAHPLCSRCLAMNPPRYTRATVVDHIIPHRGDLRLFWDEGNWQALCKSCYDHKTLMENINEKENVEVQNGE